MFPNLNNEIQSVKQHLKEIYLANLNKLIANQGGYLAFICIFTGMEALAGFNYPALRNGERFKKFITNYFDAKYLVYKDKLWELRNSLIHGFSPKYFALAQHNHTQHLQSYKSYILLNAESLLTDFTEAQTKYFHNLETDTQIQQAFAERIKNEGLLVTESLGPI